MTVSETVPETVSAEPVIALIDQLEELVSTARRLPFSANVVVNEEEVLDLIDRARLALPDDVVAARHMVEDRERIIGSAEQEAEATLARADERARQVVEEAEQRADRLTAESAITAQAHVRAEALISEAESRAAAVRSEADAYARELMQALEQQLSRALATVHKGLETLPPSDPRGRRRRA
jgi:vacuolar-type H+-ATPase subunit H